MRWSRFGVHIPRWEATKSIENSQQLPLGTDLEHRSSCVGQLYSSEQDLFAKIDGYYHRMILIYYCNMALLDATCGLGQVLVFCSAGPFLFPFSEGIWTCHSQVRLQLS